LGPLPGVDWTVPEKFKPIRALAEPLKQDGTANFNHYSVIPEGRMMQEMAWSALRKHPYQLFRKLFRNYWSFCRFTGRQPHFASYGIKEELPLPAQAWMRTYEILINQDFRSTEDLKDPAYKNTTVNLWGVSGFFLLFPIVLYLSGIKILRVWRTHPAEARAALFLLYCIVWVLLMTLFVDGREGNRMRFSTEPYWIFLVFWLIPARYNHAKE
jgi:hypothetical protein